MHPDALRSRLASYPRQSLALKPTPIEKLGNLNRILGGPTLWIKRDDGLGPGMGGNKTRPLEFLMGQALAAGKRRVVTYGGLQSNHARITAAVCARLGLEAHLFYFARKPRILTGNLILAHLFGARLHFIPFGGGGDGTMSLETTNRLVRLFSFALLGPGAFFIPVGGSNRIGSLGYVAASVEILDQIQAMGMDPSNVSVVTAVGTGGTLAGLMAGFKLLGSSVRTLGLDIGKLWKALPASLVRMSTDLTEMMGQRYDFSVDGLPLIEIEYAGPGYAKPLDAAEQAMRLLAESEGIPLDPVYTGKAFAGLLDLIDRGRFKGAEQIVFLHTGGLPALFRR